MIAEKELVRVLKGSVKTPLKIVSRTLLATWVMGNANHHLIIGIKE